MFDTTSLTLIFVPTDTAMPSALERARVARRRDRSGYLLLGYPSQNSFGYVVTDRIGICQLHVVQPMRARDVVAISKLEHPGRSRHQEFNIIYSVDKYGTGSRSFAESGINVTILARITIFPSFANVDDIGRDRLRERMIEGTYRTRSLSIRIGRPKNLGAENIQNRRITRWRRRTSETLVNTREGSASAVRKYCMPAYCSLSDDLNPLLEFIQ